MDNRQPKLFLAPVRLKEARAFVDRYHRHHDKPQGGIFAVGVMDRSERVMVEEIPLSRPEPP